MLREIYNRCSEGDGRSHPGVIITVGANLNRMLGKPLYEAKTVYIVTLEGVKEA